MCNTCQLNVEAGLNIRRCKDMYCWNCEDCYKLIGRVFESRFRYVEPGVCELYRNGAPLRMWHNKKFRKE